MCGITTIRPTFNYELKVRDEAMSLDDVDRVSVVCQARAPSVPYWKSIGNQFEFK